MIKNNKKSIKKNNKITDIYLDKSENDIYTYNFIELENNLKILIVIDNDINSQLCGSSMNINIGSINENIDGLAHFLEHMLFMGSSKYTDEHLFLSKVSQYGGESNAFTSDVNTMYYFTSSHKYYEELLDIFLYFFIDPLLKKECVNKEVNAVDSESKKNLQDDNWVLSEISKKIFMKDHPINHYTCGDKTTLKGDIHKDVKEFFTKYYSSDLMHLVLFINNNINLDKLKIYLCENLIKIKNLNLKNINRSYGQLINSGKVLKYVPISEKNRLSILFNIKSNSIDPFNPIYNNMRLFEYILENQEKDSLSYKLKNMGVLSRLYISNMSVYQDYQECSLNILFNDLTDIKLYNNFDDKFVNSILNLVFNYINNIKDIINKDDKLLQQLYEELNEKELRSYLVSENMNVTDTMLGLSSLIASNIDVKHIINYATILPSFDIMKQTIFDVFNNIDIKNCSIVIGSHNYKDICDKKDKIFNVCYSISNISDNKYIIINNKDDTKLPDINEYISSDIVLIKREDDIKPQQIEKDKYIGFYKFNYKYLSPTVDILFNIQLPKLLDINNYIGFLLYYKTLYYDINDFIYKCRSAEYLISFKISYDELYITISGFTNKINDIVDKLIVLIKNYNIKDNNNFKIVKNQIKQTENEFKTSQPIYKLSNLENKKLYKRYFTSYDILSYIDKFNEDMCIDIVSKVMQEGKTRIFISGNIEIDNAKTLIDKLNECFNVFNQISINKNVKLNKIEEKKKVNRININKEDKNNVMSYVIKLFTIKIGESKNWIKKIIFVNLLYNIVQPHIFSILRTNEQLGYSVFCKKITINQSKYSNIYFKFCIQSYIKDNNYLNQRMLRYIFGDLCKYINDLKDKEFDDFKNGLEGTYKNKFNNMSEENIYLMMHIINDKYIFDYKQLLLENISKMNIDEFKYYFNKYFNYTNPFLLFNIHSNKSNKITKIKYF